jgi:hypothetical protein
MVLTLLLPVLLSQSQPTVARRHLFDMGPPDSTVMEGFLPVGRETQYSPQRTYGWRRAPGVEYANRRFRDCPDPLTADWVAPGSPDRPGTVGRGFMEFLVDLPNGPYDVVVWCENYATPNSWRDWYDQAARWSIQAEGKTVHRVAIDHTTFVRDRYYRHLDEDYHAGEAVWDRFIAPRFRPVRFHTVVEDGQLTLVFEACPVNGLIVAPAADREATEAFLADLDRRRRKAFRFHHVEVPRHESLVEPSTSDHERGYQVYLPPYTETINCWRPPRPEELRGVMRAFATPGEFESLTLVVRPLRDLGSVQVSLGALTGSGGTIPASAVTIQRVRYLIRPAGQDRVEVVPRMLVPDTGIRAEAAINRQYWLTVHVPDTASPGLYRGTVAIWPSAARPTELAVELRVLDFRLPELTDRFHGVWYVMPQVYPDIPWDGTIRQMRDHGLNVIHGCARVSARLSGGDLRVDLRAWDDVLARYRRNAYPMRLVVCQGGLTEAYTLAKEPLQTPGLSRSSDHWVKDHFSPEFDRTYRQLARAIDEGFRARSWPDIVFYEAGEAALEGPWGLFTEHHLLEQLRQTGVPGTTSLSSVESVRRNLNCVRAAMVNQNTLSAQVIEMVHRAGVPLWLYYIGRTRFQRGFYTYRVGAQLASVEGFIHTFGDPFDEFDGTQDSWGDAWPAPGGALLGLEWEWAREGIDDHRYLVLLDRYLTRAAASKAGAARPLAERILRERGRMLEGIDLDVSPYSIASANPGSDVLDGWRWQVAVWIMQLRKELGVHAD